MTRLLYWLHELACLLLLVAFLLGLHIVAAVLSVEPFV